ncbi:MAG: HAMP domain-containing histidine kinase [Planctomycetes bacterium]|nr:HAMP domain-containing histidine kinase [Planctomycetota bacterium]
MNERLHEPAAAGVLTSRIGRRFIALFTGCALLPLVVFAWLAASRTAEQMRTEQQAMLHNHAKTTGMGVAARLSQVAGDLALAREFLPRLLNDPDGGAAKALQRHVGERCAAVWLVGDDGPRGLCGDGAVPYAPFNKLEVEHLANGRPVVRLITESSTMLMLVAVDAARPTSALLGARIRTDWFWESELFAAGSDCAVYDSCWRPIYQTVRELPDPYPLVQAAGLQPSSGTVEWISDGSPYLARYWRAFLRPQYAVDLFIVQAKRQLTGMEDFSWWFALTAVCTLLLVVFASLVQMRRTLGPIVLLRDATRALADGNLAARVSIQSRDEFSELGAAFNDMTSQLQENIRRRELTERELVASRDQALAAARAKAEFVTNVSHELRTPMTEILGAAEILSNLDDHDVHTRQEFASIALHGARRLARLVDDVLEIGSAGSWTMEVMNPTATLLDAVAMMPAPVGARIRTEVPNDLPAILGDPGRLTEVWCRLLDNAAKFSEPNSPIELRARALQDQLVVEVCDVGVGISRLDVERIFEPFCQVGRDQMTAKANGTGLGLTLAKNTIDRHGGRIEVDSELGNGSIFRVLLPTHRPAALLPLAPPEPAVGVESLVQDPALADGRG